MLPVLLFVTAVVTLEPARSPRMPEYPHVRASDPRIERLITDAARRSPTFARLYAALQETDVILFVETSRDLRGPLRGRLVFVCATPVVRYLRADVRADLSRNDMISAIAHEMQHALEVAGATLVRSELEVAALYRQIGVARSEHAFETERAQTITERVRRELLA